MKKLSLPVIANSILFVLILGCNAETPPSPEGILAAAIQKINEHPAIQY